MSFALMFIKPYTPGHYHASFVVVLMHGLWRFHHETLQYVCKLISLSSVKMISKSLDGKDVEFGLN